MTAAEKTLDRVLANLPQAYPGPGGAVAVIRDGEVLARHSWGWADVDRRLPFTPQSLFRICSISKQFTTSLMLDLHPDPSVLDADVRARMPLLLGEVPQAVHLAHNQSGLRDYWATAMLCGSPIEAPFGDAEAMRLIGMTRSLQFQPGTRYSYCNQNFRILGDIVAARAGRDYADLLRTRIFDRAGMPTARLCADTSAMPDGTTGYEGTLEVGFRPAVNNIVWTGDAGIGASLDDMIAWERFIDASRDDAASLPRRIAAPQTFRDGAAAAYGFGLSRVNLLGRRGTGHGGGLRGWRSFRFYLPAERISIVVLFNHLADPRAAALDLLGTLVDAPAKAGPAGMASWNGTYQEPETGLVVRLESTADRRVKLYYSGLSAETLEPGADGEATAGGTTLRRTPEGVRMERTTDNQSSLLAEISGLSAATPDAAGTYHADELDCDFTCIETGGTLYGAFSGFLGQGTMQLLVPAGPDLWRLPMPRALDHAPPGDWTLHFTRDATGAISGLKAGCWLARHVDFVRVG